MAICIDSSRNVMSTPILCPKSFILTYTKYIPMKMYYYMICIAFQLGLTRVISGPPIGNNTTVRIPLGLLVA